jgi:hypothetical protein
VTVLEDDAVVTDPVSGETLTAADILTLIDALPANGGHMANEDQTARKLSLFAAYTDWMPVELTIKVSRIRRLRKNSRTEAALEAAERDARLAAEQKKGI